MLKKISFFFFLTLFTFGAASSQDSNLLLDGAARLLDAAEGRLAPSDADSNSGYSFLIINNTGFTIREIYFRSTGDAGWGANVLGSPLHQGRRATVRPGQLFDLASQYSIRMKDSGGDFYSKHNLIVGNRNIITMEIKDLE